MNNNLRVKRHNRFRFRVRGTSERPRACVYRSSRRISVQLIDDTKGKTIVSVMGELKKKTNKTQQATEVGQQLAKLAQKEGIKKIVFDRGGYKYHGRIKVLAEAMREAGLEF